MSGDLGGATVVWPLPSARVGVGLRHNQPTCERTAGRHEDVKGDLQDNGSGGENAGTGARTSSAAPGFTPHFA